MDILSWVDHSIWVGGWLGPDCRATDVIQSAALIVLLLDTALSMSSTRNTDVLELPFVSSFFRLLRYSFAYTFSCSFSSCAKRISSSYCLPIVADVVLFLLVLFPVPFDALEDVARLLGPFLSLRVRIRHSLVF